MFPRMGPNAQNVLPAEGGSAKKATKETVIVVHGTFAAPEKGKTKWYEPANGEQRPGEFVIKLNAALEKRRSIARCWGHCRSTDPDYFHWSGKNSWVARIHAAAALRDYVTKIPRDWRCHIVAHSHGGTVVTEALIDGTGAGAYAARIDKIVTMGTPFINAMPAIMRKRAIARLFFAIPAVPIASASIVFLWGLLEELGIVSKDTAKGNFILNGIWLFFEQLLELIGTAAVRPFLTFFILMIIYMSNRKFNIAEYIAYKIKKVFTSIRKGLRLGTRKLTKPIPYSMLCIGGDGDEAWQVFRFLKFFEDPIRIKAPLMGYLLQYIRDNLRSEGDIAFIMGAKNFRDITRITKTIFIFVYISIFYTVYQLFDAYYAYYFKGVTGDIHGITVLTFPYAMLIVYLTLVYCVIWLISLFLGRKFLSAFLAPFRALVHLVVAIGTVPAGIATYIARRQVWGVLKRIAMGLEGYRFKTPNVSRVPEYLRDSLFKYEDMPANAQKRALARRNAWIAGRVAGVADAFSKLTVQSADIATLLEEIEKDQYLVHGAYYTEPECIEQIADWIAGKE